MPAASSGDGSLRFGSFELDVRSRELRRGETTVARLQEQPFEILRMMLEHPGDVVTREELQQRLWPGGTFVDFEHSLNAAVKRLRAVLGDDASRPTFVETVPRRGYRFIAPFLDRSDDIEGETPAPSPAVRLAVLPFDNLSSDVAQEFFVDGLTEEMIGQLGEFCRTRIAIIARTSSMRFKDSGKGAREIGEALRADYLLEGAVRQARDRIRITARLVETAGETQMWSHTYELHVTDYLSVQKDVSEHIAKALSIRLAPEPRDPASATKPTAAAYKAYLKGRYFWNLVGDAGVEQALQHLQRATGLDPSFAAAHGLLARVRILRAEYYDAFPRSELDAARQSAERALELDATLFEARLALGDVRRMKDWDWRGAEAEYIRAIDLNPSHEGARRLYGTLLAALARSTEAIDQTERACELDPLCVVASAGGAAWVRYLAGDHDNAIVRCLDAIEMEPRYLTAHRILAAAYLASGQAEKAVGVLERVLATDDNPLVMASLAHVHGMIGNRPAAVDLMDRLEGIGASRQVSPYYMALAYVGLGDTDAAFSALDRAAAERDPAVAYVAVEPRFEPIRSDGRFSPLRQRLGLK
jgi:TolB-like protein/Tfp pilus assembly protein PilF